MTFYQFKCKLLLLIACLLACSLACFLTYFFIWSLFKLQDTIRFFPCWRHHSVDQTYWDIKYSIDWLIDWWYTEYSKIHCSLSHLILSTWNGTKWWWFNGFCFLWFCLFVFVFLFLFFYKIGCHGIICPFVRQ